MTLIRNFQDISKGTPLSISIGVFDGVHLGHREIIKKAIEIGRAENIKTAVLTFEPYPEEVLLDDPPRRLSDLSLKASFIQDLGPDFLIYMRFDLEVAKIEPEDFIVAISEHINLRHVVVGANFRFGHKASGHTDDLQAFGEKYGFTVDIVPLFKKDDLTVSSTAIREMLADRQIEEAAKLLGRYPMIRGDIVYGSGKGKELGFPTVNIFPFNPGSVPGDGVYAGRAYIGGQIYKAAISVGNKPTFGGTETVVEAHLIGHDGSDLYGGIIDLEILGYIRGQQRFESKDALAGQIANDVETIKNMSI